MEKEEELELVEAALNEMIEDGHVETENNISIRGYVNYKLTKSGADYYEIY